MRIFVTPTFDRAAKKLHRLQKDELDAAVKTVAGDTQIGEETVSDLAGIRVCKCRMNNQLCLLSYRILDEDRIKLLTMGSHENFYRDLKRIEH